MKPDKNLTDNRSNSSNEDSSSSSEEDENAELLTEELEDGFFKVLSHLKKNGPERYEENVRFFPANSTEGESPDLETGKNVKNRQKEYKKWLKGKVEKVEDKEVKKELKALHDFWTSPTLNENEQFLRDYILNKKFLDPDENLNIEEEIKKLSDEEKEIEEELEFEYKYNCRFENSDKELTTNNKSKNKNKKDKYNEKIASQESNKTYDTETSPSKVRKDKKSKQNVGRENNETIDTETSQFKVKKEKENRIQGSSKHPNKATSQESVNLEIEENKSVVAKKTRKRKRKRKGSPANKIFNGTKKSNEKEQNLGKQVGIPKCKVENNSMDMDNEENLQSNKIIKETVQSGSLLESLKKKRKKLDTNVRSTEGSKNNNLPRNKKMKNTLGKRRKDRSRKKQTQNKHSSGLDQANFKGSRHQNSKKEQLVNTNITSKENKGLKVRDKKRRRSTSSSGFKTFVGGTKPVTTKRDKQFQNLIVKEKKNKQNKLSQIQKKKQKAEKVRKR